MVEPLGDGGITHYTYNLINALSANHVDCRLFTAKTYEFEQEWLIFRCHQSMFRMASLVVKLVPNLSKENSLPHTIRRALKLMEYPFNVLEAILICNRDHIKCVHIQSVNMIELLFIIFLKIFGIKVVFTVHNIRPLHRTLTKCHTVFYHLMYKLCDQIIVHTRKGKEEIVQFFNIYPDKVNIIPHGDYKFFVPKKRLTNAQAKRKLGLASDTKTILFFGAIRDNKGLEQILLAMPQITKSIKDVKLMIVGELTCNYKKYKNIINGINIKDYVFEKLTYIPNRDVSLYFFASDVVVLPYHEVTGSGVLQLAYAFAKPIVASDLDGFREYISSGKNGYIVPVKRPKLLAHRIIDILQNDTKIVRMGRYSAYLADSMFSWKQIAAKTRKIYDLALT